MLPTALTPDPLNSARLDWGGWAQHGRTWPRWGRGGGSGTAGWQT